MAGPDSPKAASFDLSARRRSYTMRPSPLEIEPSISRRVAFTPGREAFAPARRMTSFDSTVAGAVDPQIGANLVTSHVSPKFASRPRLQGLDQLEGLQSPIGGFLDETYSNEEETDVEYESDTASYISSEDEEAGDRHVETTPPPPSTQANSAGTIYKVISSRITHYGDEEAQMAIELKCGHMEDAEGAEDVFRWIHTKQDVMDFDHFIETSLQTLRMSVQEKRAVKQKLESVQRQHEKPFFAQYANQGRNMEPFVAQELDLQDMPAQSHLDKKITIACFPFLLLENHIKRIRLQSPTSHPPLTLLQSVVSSTEPERDLRQVVCKTAVGQKHRCFYIGQLWCLIIDDGLICTCARLPEELLCGDVVTIHKEPTRGTPHVPFIKVTDGGNCTWQLRLDECQTWFDFTSNFMEISSSISDVVRRFEDIFRVTIDGRTIDASDWRKVIRRGRERTIHLVLTRRNSVIRLLRVHNAANDDSSSIADTEKVFPWQVDDAPVDPKGQGILEPIDDYIHGIGPEFETDTPRTTSRDFASQPQPADASTDPFSAHTDHGPRNSNAGQQSSLSDKSEEVNNDVFHALENFTPSRRNSNESVRDISVDPDARKVDLANFMAGAHQKLLRNAIDHEKRAYGNCRLATLPQATKYLLVITRTGDNGFVHGLSALDTFFVAAVQVFEFFLPLGNESEMAKRFWGSVLFIMKNVLVDPRLALSRPITRSMNSFKRLAHLASVLQKEFSNPQGPDLTSTSMPREFRKAWLHCMLYLAMFRFKSKNIRERERHLEKCEALLDRGRNRLWRAAAKVPLHKKEVATPLALMSVIISNLVKDISRQGPRLDIVHVYREYWQELEVNVKNGRVKTAQKDIVNLQQEIRAIRKTLIDQLETLRMLYKCIEEQSKGWSSLNNRHLGHAPRPELPLIGECIEDVKNRLKAFGSIGGQSTMLEQWINEQLASTKHRHENAIYAFTIVTVIFLPLSFVCSFLGMNTAGIRDMENGQWVFWAAALPLTIIVIFLTLLWTDELGHAWKAVQRLIWIHDKGFGFAPQSDQRPYWKLTDEEKREWRNIWRRKKVTKQLPPSITVSRPPLPPTQSSVLDPWDRPYRRTETFRSVLD
ncbi:hypothetical protein K458DRAFT_419701 [Lentithecium fluviatile CBS 122367]|uniref:Cora-domain-containing protein n=1 Tax=Lentithecium fluviatile CBS 122367 TaxID=1168545 RepID=A0A6G1IY24_9PLEO|nr:hypothetical protein K458DRAFT_419701 [Lentithecium fluviatile CBS 122367]